MATPRFAARICEEALYSQQRDLVPGGLQEADPQFLSTQSRRNYLFHLDPSRTLEPFNTLARLVAFSRHLR